MPAFDLRPTAQGTYSNAGWVATGAASKWQAVADDSDASYINNSTAGSDTESYTMSDLPGDAVAVSGSVVFGSRGQSFTADKNLFPYVKEGGSELAGTVLTHPTGSITDLTRDFATAAGGGAWTVANLNATELMLEQGNNTNILRLFRLRFTGNYTQAGATFITFYHWLLPFAGVLAKPDFFRMLQVWHQYTHRGWRRLVPAEYEFAWREFRRYARPVFLKG